MTFTTLDCDRLSIDVAAGAARERAPKLERELTEALSSHLAPALAPYATGRDDGVRLFIDRVVIDGAIGGRWEPDAIVRRVAERIAAAVSAEIDGGGGLRFRDRAEFVAAFVAALADGTAWSRWWFDAFDGFKAMSASNAIRSVVLSEAQTGITALARLTPETAKKVAAALRPADAARLVAAFRARRSLALPPLRRMWRDSAALGTAQDTPERWLLALLACERAVSGSAGDEAVRTMLDLRRLRDLAAAAEPTRAPDDEDGLRAWLRALASRSGQAMLWIDRAASGDLREIARDLSAVDRVPVMARQWTRYGGAFLLLKVLAGLDWFERCVREMDPDDGRLLAFAIVARALLPRATARLFDDDALRSAFAVDDVRRRLHERRRPLRRRLASAGFPRLASAAAATLNEFASRVPGLAGSTHDYLRRNVLDLPAAVRVRADAVLVEFGRAPLDVLLVLSGAKHGGAALPGSLPLRMSPETAG